MHVVVSRPEMRFLRSRLSEEGPKSVVKLHVKKKINRDTHRIFISHVSMARSSDSTVATLKKMIFSLDERASSTCNK